MFTPFSFQLDLYRNYNKTKHTKVYDELMSFICQLPNFTHPLTPIGDSSKARHLYINGSKREENWKLLDAISITSGSKHSSINHNNINSSISSINPVSHLRVKHTTLGAGHRTYYFSGPLAQLESALIAYTVDRLKKSGFEFVSVPDILPEPIIKACGFPTQGIRSQIYEITPPISKLTYCLSGTSEIALAGFCAGRSFNCTSSENDRSDESNQSSALGLCAVSRCFRKEVPNQEPTLYRVHQFTK
ncbi:unnamed protein product, partial [Schistosoma turkestanicum]